MAKVKITENSNTCARKDETLKDLNRDCSCDCINIIFFTIKDTCITKMVKMSRIMINTVFDICISPAWFCFLSVCST